MDLEIKHEIDKMREEQARYAMVIIALLIGSTTHAKDPEVRASRLVGNICGLPDFRVGF